MTAWAALIIAGVALGVAVAALAEAHAARVELERQAAARRALDSLYRQRSRNGEHLAPRGRP